MRLLVVLCVFIRALALISNAADRVDTAWSQLEGLNAKANEPVPMGTATALARHGPDAAMSSSSIRRAGTPRWGGLSTRAGWASCSRASGVSTGRRWRNVCGRSDRSASVDYDVAAIYIFGKMSALRCGERDPRNARPRCERRRNYRVSLRAG